MAAACTAWARARAIASPRKWSARPKCCACTSRACAPGLVYVPINPALTPAEVGYYLADAEPRIVMMDPGRPRPEPLGAAAETAPAGAPRSPSNCSRSTRRAAAH